MQLLLNGSWQATPDLGQQARAGKPGYVPAGWFTVPVPGHWQAVPGLEQHTQPLLYRRAFQSERAAAPGEAARLCFEGVMYGAKVWLNGTFLGEHTGYFTPAAYDVTRTLRAGENVVMVEVECPPPDRALTGAYQDAMPGGIWRDVSLRTYQGAVPESFTVQAVPDLARGSATVSLDLGFTALAEGTLDWTATITPETFEGEPLVMTGMHAARRGLNRLAVSLTQPDPRLWWTWDRGRPDLYRLTLSCRLNGGEPVTLERIFGVRQVELDRGLIRLNGQRLFLRGTCYTPAHRFPAAQTVQAYERDLALMRGANMNTVRVYAHVDRPELYERASRQGMLVWQDFPLYGAHARAVGDEARRQARAMVDVLGHWPAIGLWNCYTEPQQPDEPPAFLERTAAALWGNWARSSLAPALRKIVIEADPSRHCLAQPEPAPYWGWHTGSLAKGNKADRTTLVAEFGAQAFPWSPEFVSGTWPNINWEQLAKHHELQAKTLERHVPISGAQTFEQYAAATQQYQATLHQQVIEYFRQRKYHPAGGVLQYRFTDAGPAVSWSITDEGRVPKPAYDAVRRAFQPRHIMAEWPGPVFKPGTRIALAVFVVNDLGEPCRGQWRWAVERRGEQLAGGGAPVELQPDGLVAVPAGVDWTVPAGQAPGAVDLLLTLDLDDGTQVTNTYRFNILPEI